MANEVPENVEEADLAAVAVMPRNHGIQVQLSNGSFFGGIDNFFWVVSFMFIFWKYLNILESPIKSLSITSSVDLKVLKITFFFEKEVIFKQ